jgi:hypothetical protein
MSPSAPIKTPPRYFYKYTSVQTAFNVLKTGKLRWGSPAYYNRINDYFDTPKSIHFGFSGNELLQEFITTLAGHIEAGAVDLPEGHPGARDALASAREAASRSSMSFAEIAQSMRSKFTADKLSFPEPLVDTFQRLWEEMRPMYRILCMSAVTDSAPMWTHYATQNEGVVLQFEPSLEFESALGHMREVTYTDEQPTIFTKEQGARDAVGIDKINFSEFFSEHLYRKATSWSYEKEWRTVVYAHDVDQGDTTDFGFLPVDLRGITFGHRCSSESETLLRVMCGKFLGGGQWNHVRFARARLVDNTRKIVIDELP